MGYDDVKEWNGQPYTGMAVGRGHAWDYDGLWLEDKVSPDRWNVTFNATKRRSGIERGGKPGMPGGADVGSMYHWLIVGHQRVRKVASGEYLTLLEATKWKVGHRRPHWKSWSTEYDGQMSARQVTALRLSEYVSALRKDEIEGAAPLERTPGVLFWDGSA